MGKMGLGVFPPIFLPISAHGKNTMERPWENAMGQSWAQSTRRYENQPHFQDSDRGHCPSTEMKISHIFQAEFS
jgi:hypothetical protein